MKHQTIIIYVYGTKITGNHEIYDIVSIIRKGKFVAEMSVSPIVL